MKQAIAVGFVLAVAYGASACGPTAATPSIPAPSATANPTPAAPSPASGAEAHETDRAAKLEFRGANFYEVPDPLPPGDRGTLIRLQSMRQVLHPVYRVLYHSTSVDGTDVAVSGTVWVPSEAPPSDGYPIVAWGPGNNGSGDPCAYSRAGTPEEIDYNPLMFNFLRAGYVVAYTDYQGHGTRYPYLFAVPESSTHSLLDAARAARDLLGDVASNRVVVAGHSLGADAAAASLQHGRTYAGELDVRGALIVEGGADVAELIANATAGVNASGVVQGIAGWASAYPELDPADVLTARALRDVGSLESSCGTAQSFSGRPAKDIFAAHPRNVAAWNKRIEASTVKQVPFPAFFVVAETSASHVQQIRTVAQRLCRVSPAVRLEVYPGTDHDGVLQAALQDYIQWIADRFAGVAAAGNCNG
ncbi:MAG TPA: lipase family protein [Candidatus Limnocylindria bacterium]|nr:lipase family protein [Candidatus Limnocylindria bacterium]